MTCENLERCFQNSRRRSRIDTWRLPRFQGGGRTPGFAETASQAKLHQPQQRQRRHLNLERPQHRFFRPRPTFFHAQSLLVVAEAVFLAKTSAVGRKRLACRQVGGAGDRGPQLVVAGHLEHKGEHDLFGPADRPATSQALVAERADAAVDVGSALLPRHVPLVVLLRRWQSLSPFARTAALRIFGRRDQRLVQSRVSPQSRDELDPTAFPRADSSTA